MKRQPSRLADILETVNEQQCGEYIKALCTEAAAMIRELADDEEPYELED